MYYKPRVQCRCARIDHRYTPPGHGASNCKKWKWLCGTLVECTWLYTGEYLNGRLDKRVGNNLFARLASHAQSTSLHLLSTFDVTHVIKYTRLSPRFFVSCGPKVIRKNCACVGESLGPTHIPLLHLKWCRLIWYCGIILTCV